jgi:hypothetical protein
MVLLKVERGISRIASIQGREAKASAQGLLRDALLGLAELPPAQGISSYHHKGFSYLELYGELRRQSRGTSVCLLRFRLIVSCY